VRVQTGGEAEGKGKGGRNDRWGSRSKLSQKKTSAIRFQLQRKGSRVKRQKKETQSRIIKGKNWMALITPPTQGNAAKGKAPHCEV